VGHEGAGYCDSVTDGGYKGLRCEQCATENRYFDKLDARCHDCGDTTSKVLGLICALLAVGIAAAVGANAATRQKIRPRGCLAKLRLKLRSAQALWQKSGMKFKVKAF